MDFITENVDGVQKKLAFLKSLFSNSIKNDPALGMVMPKFSFRLGRNK